MSVYFPLLLNPTDRNGLTIMKTNPTVQAILESGNIYKLRDLRVRSALNQLDISHKGIKLYECLLDSCDKHGNVTTTDDFIADYIWIRKRDVSTARKELVEARLLTVNKLGKRYPARVDGSVVWVGEGTSYTLSCVVSKVMSDNDTNADIPKTEPCQAPCHPPCRLGTDKNTYNTPNNNNTLNTYNINTLDNNKDSRVNDNLKIKEKSNKQSRVCEPNISEDEMNKAIKTVVWSYDAKTDTTRSRRVCGSYFKDAIEYKSPWCSYYTEYWVPIPDEFGFIASHTKEATWALSDEIRDEYDDTDEWLEWYDDYSSGLPSKSSFKALYDLVTSGGNQGTPEPLSLSSGKEWQVEYNNELELYEATKNGKTVELDNLSSTVPLIYAISALVGKRIDCVGDNKALFDKLRDFESKYCPRTRRSKKYTVNDQLELIDDAFKSVTTEEIIL